MKHKLIAIFCAFLLPHLSRAAGSVAIYQGATATLSSNPSLVTYTTKVTPLRESNYTWVPSADNAPPVFKDTAPVIEDTAYVNGIYTCDTSKTVSLNANLAVAGTLAVNSTVLMAIQVSNDGGATWADFKSEGAGPTTGLGKTYGKVSNVVPCVAGGKIRIVASTTVLLPQVSTVLPENSLTITKLF